MIKHLFEVFDEVGKQTSAKKKAEVLRANNSDTLRAVLRGSFDPSIEWQLPEGPAPFKPMKDEDVSMIHKEHRRFYVFIKGLAPGLTRTRREQLWIETLESVHPKDAEILTQMKDKKLTAGGVTAEIVRMAFPALLPPPRVDSKAKTQ